MLIIIGIGGFIGAILRYLLSGLIQNNPISFPFGTLCVNFIGSFFLSMIMYLSEYHELFNEESRVFLTIGLLGAFTTMSTFSYESYKLFEQKEILMFLLNLIGNVTLTFLAVYLGKLIIVYFWKG
jgi:fluoride exporter